MAKIGVFDSGIGGLTLAAEIKKVLPEHSIIYFGDTAHFPYGEKSTTSIQVYAIKICNLLLEQGCEIILIACNSASASSYELVKEYVGKRAKVFNVIDSVVDYVCASYSGHEVGLIGTKRTFEFLLKHHSPFICKNHALCQNDLTFLGNTIQFP